MNRVFEVCQTFQDEMDFKTFAEFTLALQSLYTRQGLQYFWRIIDTSGSGTLDTFTLNFYIREIVARMEQLGGGKLQASTIIAEVIDMVKPQKEGVLSFRDIENSSMGHWVVRILCDFNGFWEYENRESMTPAN